MRVLIGSFNTVHGTVETSPEGLVYAGSNPEHVRAIVENERQWYDRSGIEHTLGDLELVYSLPYRLQGYILWAVSVDEVTGLTMDQPPYDPLGDVWYNGKKAPGPVYVSYSLPSAEELAREAKQQEWNRRAAEWVAQVKDRAKAQRKGP
jgi:hypothetical protein